MKYAVVTGGTRGIGLAIVKRLVKEGYLVTATYSSDEEARAQAEGECPEACFVKADVSKEEDVVKTFERLPFVDLLVNNAGVSYFSQVQDVPYAEWERVMAVNMGGCFLMSKHAVKKLLKREGGAIVNVASVWGVTGASCESVYSASKGAMIAFTKSLAKELASANIRVNCVAPGVIDTRMNVHFTPEEREELIGEIPVGRMGTAEEIAEVVAFLAGQGYITGQIIGVNGGFYV